MNANQRTAWERRIGIIGVAYTEKYVAEVLDELAKANPLRFECPWCECKWQFHTQAQLDMIQRHMNAHMDRFGRGPHLLTARDGSQALCGGTGCCPACDREASAVQAAVGSLSAVDRAEMEKE